MKLIYTVCLKSNVNDFTVKPIRIAVRSEWQELAEGGVRLRTRFCSVVSELERKNRHFPEACFRLPCKPGCSARMSKRLSSRFLSNTEVRSGNYSHDKDGLWW